MHVRWKKNLLVRLTNISHCDILQLLLMESVICTQNKYLRIVELHLNFWLQEIWQTWFLRTRMNIQSYFVSWCVSTASLVASIQTHRYISHQDKYSKGFKKTNYFIITLRLLCEQTSHLGRSNYTTVCMTGMSFCSLIMLMTMIHSMSPFGYYCCMNANLFN